MKKPVNILNDCDPSLLAETLEVMARSRARRHAEADFESYLDFLEETSAFFGFKKKRADSFKTNGDPPLL
jgi:hypothetical protein